MENNITIKLGILEFNNHEESINSFYNRMRHLIMDSVNKYYVRYHKEENYYEVCYDGELYRVKDGDKDLKANYEEKEVIYRFNSLVELTNFQEKIDREKSERNITSEYEREKIYDEVQKRFAKEYEKNVNKLENKRKEYDEDKLKILEETKRVIIYINKSDFLLEEKGIFAIPVLITGGCSLIFSGPLWLTIICLAILADIGSIIIAGGLLNVDYAGIFMSILSIIVSPFILLGKSLKKLAGRIKFNKSVENYSTTISQIKKMTKNQTKSEKRFNKSKDSNVREINLLREKIAKINNEESRLECEKELKDIVEYFLEVLNNFKKSDRDEIVKTIHGLVESLNNKIDMFIDEEKNGGRVLCSDHYEIMNSEDKTTTIEEKGFQKSIGKK